METSKLPITEEELIETVRRYSNLYDPADKYRHEILRKDNAWEEISATIKCPGNYQIRAVPWLRSLVTGLSPRRPGFAPGSIHVGFVVDKVTLEQVFLRVLRFSSVNIIPPSLSKLITSGECVIC
jgi:hypothetical protein